MFSCQNCTRNLVRAVLSVSAEEHAQLLRFRTLQSATASSRKAAYATRANQLSKVRDADEQARIDAGLPVDVQTYKEAAMTAMRGNTAIQRYKRGKDDAAVQKLDESVSVLDGKTPVDLNRLRRYARMELQYIEEPYRLADRSLILLKNGEVDQALELVRMAGKDGMKATVSWNHILNTMTKAGHLDTAWKLFNEMKKNGQKPDSYTISILLRGYGLQGKTKKVSHHTAIKIYDSIHAPTSSVKPHIIHTNAALEACARAEDLESLFSIAARLPRTGPNSPDDITYTTIFNALANANPRDQDKQHENRQRLISQARRIWPEVLEKWKTGRLIMSEKLVCSIGRVLLTSHLKADRDDVFSLVEQTMRIPRQFDKLQKVELTPARDSQITTSEREPALGLPEPENEKDIRTPNEHKSSSPEPEVDLNALFDAADGEQAVVLSSTGESHVLWSINSDTPESSRTDAVQESKQLASQHSESGNTHEAPHNKVAFNTMQAAGLVFAKPGNSTLSMIINACSSIKEYDGAIKYWELLRKKLIPDTVNYIDYMKMLKDSRASSLATDVLREIYKLSKDHKSDIEMVPVFFWHGLSACVRAKETQTALQDGTRILAMLQMVAAEPHPQMVEMFTSILSREHAQFPVRDVERAMEALMVTFGNIKSLYAFGRTDDNGPNEPSTALTEVIHDIDSKWRPLIRRSRFGLARSRQDILTEARTRISMSERQDLRNLGRTIELVIGRVLNLYRSSFNEAQLSRIRADLYRVRAWVFPRDKDWKTEWPKGSQGATKGAPKAQEEQDVHKFPSMPRSAFEPSPHKNSRPIHRGRYTNQDIGRTSVEQARAA